jgi:hypothetical protein
MQPNEPSVYRSPDLPNTPAPMNPRAVRAFAMAVSPFVALPLTTALSFLFLDGHRYSAASWLPLVFLAMGVVCLVLAILGTYLASKVKKEVPKFPVPERGLGLAKAAWIVGPFGAIFSVLGFFAACISTIGFTRGRQLRRFGKPLLPRVTQGTSWTTLTLDVAIPEVSRAALASQWRENGRTEHASVAAFARLTLDLMGLGAPASLLTSANRDAADEVRHTELCFSLARAMDGREESPGAFPDAAKARTLSSVRSVALAQLAVDSLVDGALHEGVSARIIAKLSKRCELDSIRSVLKEIAADEGRHATHGWDVVAWCLLEGKSPVASALIGALNGLPDTMHSPLPPEAGDGSWEKWGIHGHPLEADVYAHCLRDIKTRIQRMCMPYLRA